MVTREMTVSNEPDAKGKDISALSISKLRVGAPRRCRLFKQEGLTS